MFGLSLVRVCACFDKMEENWEVFAPRRYQSMLRRGEDLSTHQKCLVFHGFECVCVPERWKRIRKCLHREGINRRCVGENLFRFPFVVPITSHWTFLVFQWFVCLYVFLVLRRKMEEKPRLDTIKMETTVAKICNGVRQTVTLPPHIELQYSWGRPLCFVDSGHGGHKKIASPCTAQKRTESRLLRKRSRN